MGKFTLSVVEHASIHEDGRSLYIMSVCEEEARANLADACLSGRPGYIETYTDQMLDFGNAALLEDYRRRFECGIPSIYE